MTTLWSAPVVAVVVFVGALTMGYGARMVQAGHEDSSLCADRWGLRRFTSGLQFKRAQVDCRSGNRSSQAAALMADLGFTQVHDLDGGIIAWHAAGASTLK